MDYFTGPAFAGPFFWRDWLEGRSQRATYTPTTAPQLRRPLRRRYHGVACARPPLLLSHMSGQIARAVDAARIVSMTFTGGNRMPD